MAINDGDLMTRLVQSVEDEISEQSREIVEKHKKQMGEEIDAVIRDTIGKLGLRIAKHSSISMMGDTIRIEISDRRD
jgi:citrate lyase gamma subunit